MHGGQYRGVGDGRHAVSWGGVWISKIIAIVVGLGDALADE